MLSSRIFTTVFTVCDQRKWLFGVLFTCIVFVFNLSTVAKCMNVLYFIFSKSAGQFSDHSESMCMTSSHWGSKAWYYCQCMFFFPYTHLELAPLWMETRQYVTIMFAKTACMDFGCQNNLFFAGWDNVQHSSSNGFPRGSITKFWFECDQNILIQNVFLTKIVTEIGRW